MFNILSRQSPYIDREAIHPAEGQGSGDELCQKYFGRTGCNIKIKKGDFSAEVNSEKGMVQ